MASNIPNELLLQILKEHQGDHITLARGMLVNKKWYVICRDTFWTSPYAPAMRFVTPDKRQECANKIRSLVIDATKDVHGRPLEARIGYITEGSDHGSAIDSDDYSSDDGSGRDSSDNESSYSFGDDSIHEISDDDPENDTDDLDDDPETQNFPYLRPTAYPLVETLRAYHGLSLPKLKSLVLNGCHQFSYRLDPGADRAVFSQRVSPFFGAQLEEFASIATSPPGYTLALSAPQKQLSWLAKVGVRP
ncbi:hypothetical protein ANO11243_084350 [Dothideomycetidae sp. 11243]|nr:hypothetical protein ANO11243_084350 [fungal sp. No.11243]